MRLQNVVGALVNPKGMTRNSKLPYRVTHVVLASSPSATRTCQYLDRKSSLVKYSALLNRSNSSATNDIRYLFLMVTLFKAQNRQTSEVRRLASSETAPMPLTVLWRARLNLHPTTPSIASPTQSVLEESSDKELRQVVLTPARAQFDDPSTF